MNTTEKGKSGLKRTFPLVLYLSVVLTIILFLSTYLFLKSSSFPRLVEQIINSHTERPVEIGSISLAKGFGIVIRDVIMREDDKGEPIIILPHVEIGISLSVLLNRSIDTVDIRKPKLFLILKKYSKPEDKESIPSLPVSFKKVSIEDGEVMLQIEEGKTFHMSSINLSFEETYDKKAEVKGNVFLNEFNLTVPVEAVLDMERFNIEKGHLDITLRELENLSVKNFALLKHREIKGSVSLGVDIYREDRLGIKLDGHFQGIKVNGHDKPPLLENASGELNALFTVSEDYQRVEIEASGILNNPLWDNEWNHKVILKGAYDVKAHELKIENASISSSLFGSLDIEGSLKNFPSKNPGIVLAIKGKDIPLHDIKGVLTGSLAELMGAVDAEGYGKVALSITGNLETPLIITEAEVMYQDIDLNKVARGFPHFFSEKGFALRGTGVLHSTFTATMPEGADPYVIGKANLSITRGGFSSPDAFMAGEGIDMNISSSFRFSLPLSTAEFTINAQATDFELLLGSFYGDFTDRDVSLSLQGKYSRAKDALIVSSSGLSIKDIGTILISGEIVNLTESPRFTADVHLRELSNKSAYDFFIREIFQERFAFLSQLETGGMTSMELLVQGTAERFDARGELNVMDMDILGRSSDLSIQGINIFLPVDVSYPGGSFSQDAGLFGSLGVQNISWGALHLKDLEVFPAIRQNALIFKEDVFIPIFGGSVRFEDINYNDLFSLKRKLILSISIDDIDLDKVSRTLKIPRFSGNLSGLIPQASIVGSSLHTEGEISIELFGGEMRVSNLSVSNIFGPVSSVKASVEIQDIDLGRLTETFEFGHISGIMQGYVKDLVITKGQAESFEALIETVQRKGVSQRISVEALKKISILGSGSTASILSSGIYQFFKEYRYKKIGFRGSLRNDNFLLLGIEAEGNKEYLVKGGLLPPRVDVISYTQHISFQEMVKRLKRIKLVESEKMRVE